MLGLPSPATATPELRGWLKVFGAGLHFPDLPPELPGGHEESNLGSLTSADLRMELGVNHGSVSWELAVVGHGQWMVLPEAMKALGGSFPGGGSNADPAGRLLDVRLDQVSGDFSFVGDVDRLSVTLWWGETEFVVGRQAVSWARTMIFQPLDVLGPFSLLSFDTEAKPGIDALRIRLPALAEGTLDLILNQDKDPSQSAYAGRMTMLFGPFEIGLSGGHVRDEWMAGFDGVWSFDQWSLRWEGLYLPERSGSAGFVGALGFDRFFLNGDLQAFMEFLHDGRGAASVDDLISVFSSAEFTQGRLKVPSRNAASIGFRYQWAALWSLNLSLVTDLRQKSGLGLLQISRSLSDDISADFIVYQPFGKTWELAPGVGLRPGSSFGSFPSMAALYLRLYQ